VKVDETSEIKEQKCTRSYAQSKLTYTWYSRFMIRTSRLYLYSRLVLQTESKGLRFFNRLIDLYLCIVD